ncbi:hypothetical protein BS78_05G270600 [Paspalum vaginatum]|nr:hypothetical protein BS78_05G270600 [Paspalum vaginatum]
MEMGKKICHCCCVRGLKEGSTGLLPSLACCSRTGRRRGATELLHMGKNGGGSAAVAVRAREEEEDRAPVGLSPGQRWTPLRPRRPAAVRRPPLRPRRLGLPPLRRSGHASAPTGPSAPALRSPRVAAVIPERCGDEGEGPCRRGVERRRRRLGRRSSGGQRGGRAVRPWAGGWARRARVAARGGGGGGGAEL